jgi:hypothetical protein
MEERRGGGRHQRVGRKKGLWRTTAGGVGAVARGGVRYLQGYFRNFTCALVCVLNPQNAFILGRMEYFVILLFELILI